MEKFTIEGDHGKFVIKHLELWKQQCLAERIKQYRWPKPSPPRLSRRVTNIELKRIMKYMG
jgi:hypothetical protein